jgi:hypothetical protein
MKLLCREDHNGGASRSDVGDRRSNSDWAVKNGAAANPTAGLRAAGMGTDPNAGSGASRGVR